VRKRRPADHLARETLVTPAQAYRTAMRVL